MLSGCAKTAEETQVPANFTKKRAHEKALHKSSVKWFAEWQMLKQILLQWPAVLNVINYPTDFSPAHRQTLRKIIDEFPGLIRVELALAIDLGEYLVKLCYLSEGDGLL